MLRHRAVLSVFLLLAPAAGAQVLLQNDGFIAGGTVNFQGGFVAGEMGAARLTGPWAQAKLDQVQLMFGGATETRTVVLHVWDDTALTTDPGAELYFNGVELQGTDTAMQIIDLSLDNVIVPATFRVGVEMTDAGLPSLARNSAGTGLAANNYLLVGPSPFTWYQAATLGLTGDLVIRALVSPLATDGGTDGGPSDAGSDDGGSDDAGSTADAGPTADSGVPVTDAGAGCDSNSDCSTGTSCNLTTRRCSFDCRTDADCGGSDTCNSLGRCVPAPAGGCGCTSVDLAPFLLLALGLLLRRR